MLHVARYHLVDKHQSGGYLANNGDEQQQLVYNNDDLLKPQISELGNQDT